MAFQHGEGQVRKPLQGRHEDQHDRVRRIEQERQRQESTGDRERHDEQAHHGNRERIGERRDERHLLEERHEHRQHDHGDGELLENGTANAAR